MQYEEFLNRTTFSHEELVANAKGRLVEDAPAEFLRLPSPPMLMLSRVTAIEKRGVRGRIVGEFDVRLDDWSFQCHFDGDPIQPGVLGLDAIFQLLGLYCAVNGGVGMGRALGCGEVDFFGGIRPHDSVVRYEVDIRRCATLSSSGVTVSIGTADVFVDDVRIYRIEKARVGTFLGIRYPDYPLRSANSTGGVLETGEI
ncbi:MAG: bifunctional 3-hydroxydecanoyl-ACP dehydratase/trans-2-decenoyl-ACP isomerase [Planctomycetes bacterium]|nr:bifunctional 3-hydroxydecanoyl-ACP dehydratase/trans-2-decenoyl-ACP isomerase [Planctomycetota bacterium]